VKAKQLNERMDIGGCGKGDPRKKGNRGGGMLHKKKGALLKVQSMKYDKSDGRGRDQAVFLRGGA